MLEIIHEDLLCTILRHPEDPSTFHCQSPEGLEYPNAIKFQSGNPANGNENGLSNEGVIKTVIARLTDLNANVPSVHNQVALEHLQKALVSLEERHKEIKEKMK